MSFTVRNLLVAVGCPLMALGIGGGVAGSVTGTDWLVAVGVVTAWHGFMCAALGTWAREPIPSYPNRHY